MLQVFEMLFFTNLQSIITDNLTVKLKFNCIYDTHKSLKKHLRYK